MRLVGRTEGDEIVSFDGPAHLVGTMARIRTTEATHLTILGEWQDDGAQHVQDQSLLAGPASLSAG
ncbi:MAG: hypothetical protein R3C68_05670 [Myxococcota bacterium]